MRFKRLEMVGFKSFADRTRVDFQPGVTAIVGPNGCGKSNVSDALRWVLGEQSAHQLRGDSAVDFIFKGAGKRKMMGLAEVTLTIDNSDHSVAGPFADFAEIQVTRRVHRDGEREYFINKVPCRLKDIRDIFMDTGMSGRGVAILQQGHIDAILNAKPEERRALFDEAAGITKYKIKKEAAQRKLVTSEENLARVMDIVHEVERQMRRLDRQARDAERFKRLRATLRTYEAHVSCARLAELNERAAVVEGEMADARRLLEDTESRLAATTAELEAARLRVREGRQEADELRERAATLRHQAAKLEGEIATERARLEGIDRERAGLAGDVDQWRERLELLAARGGALAAEAEEAEAAHGEAVVALEQQEACLRDRVNEREQCRTTLQEQRRAAMAAAEARSKAQARAESLARRLDELGEQEQRLALAGAALEVDVEGHAARREEVEAAVTRAEQVSADADSAVGAARETLAASQSRLATARSAREAQAQILHRLEARATVLADLVARPAPESETPLPAEARAWEEAPTVAAALRVEPELEGAVEALLGETLHARVLSDRGVAAALARWASDQSIPPTTVVLPPTAAEIPPPPPAGGTALLDGVSTANGLAPWLAERLGRVVVVDDLAAAVAAPPEGWTCIARDGQRLEGNGLLHLGHAGGEESGTLARHRELREMEEALPGARAALAAAEREVVEATEAVAGCEAELAAATTAAHEARLALQSARHNREAAEAEQRRLARRRDDHQGEVTRLAEGRAGVEAELVRLRAEVARGETEAETGSARITEAEQALATAEERLEGVRQEVVAAKVLVGEAEGRLRHLRGELTAIREEEQRGRDERSAKSARATDLDRQEAEGHVRLRRLEGELSTALSVEEGARAELQLALDRVAGVEEGVATLSQREHQLIATREQEQERHHRAEQEAAEVRHTAHETRVRFEDRYQTTPEEARDQGEPVEVELAEMEREIPELARKLDRIGPVNLSAIAEHEELAERLDFLTGQRTDLEQAIDDIRQAIRRINRTSRERFITTFEQIDHHFGELFTALFEGGQAKLHLLDPDNPLESGIEITAQPPGKKNGSINLLSGGEKALTTLALIFSTYRVRPAPFCLLDEVDAPLDDANVGRFNRLLRTMAISTQFTAITHNKSTMEAADALYGITMAEPGVSSLIAVHLEEEPQLAMGEAVAVG